MPTSGDVRGARAGRRGPSVAADENVTPGTATDGSSRRWGDRAGEGDGDGAVAVAAALAGGNSSDQEQFFKGPDSSRH